MVLAGLQRFEPSLLAEAVHHCGRLGARCGQLGRGAGAFCWPAVHPSGVPLWPAGQATWTAHFSSFTPPLTPAATCSEEMLLDEVGRHLMKDIHALSPADIAALVGGYAALDHSPSAGLFVALAARAEAVAGQFSHEQQRRIAEGYASLGYAAKVPRLA